MVFASKIQLASLVATGLLPFTRAAVPAIEGFEITWSDDFVGTANSLPNTADWTAVPGTSYPGGAANWGTNEIETVSYLGPHIFHTYHANMRLTPISHSTHRASTTCT